MAQRDMVILLVGKPGLAPPMVADSGLLALKLLRELRPRLLLIGGDLPEAEALELLRQIKKDWPEIGCLVLAACAVGRQMALAAGADQVLGVGLAAGQLYVVLQGMLEHAFREVAL